MLRTKITRLGMASAGVAVGAIMAISPVFAQGTTTPSNPTTGDTLLASILAAVQGAGITLTAEQTQAITEVVMDITEQPTVQAPEPADTENEDEDDTDDDNGAAGAAAQTNEEQTQHKTTVKVSVPKSSEESKGDD